MPIPTYANSQAIYAELGVDTETALTRLASVPISMHCWQGDDLGGVEKTGSAVASPSPAIIPAWRARWRNFAAT